MAKNAWIDFLAKYRKQHPGKSMKQCMKDAAKVWKSQKGGKASKSSKSKKGKKKTQNSEEQLLGGAIESPQLADIEPRGPELDNFHKILQNAAFQESAPVNLRHVADAMMDYRPRNEIAFSQYANFYQRHPEDYLAHNAAKLFSGHGGNNDHPRVQKLFHDSFHGYPDLLDKYSRSRIKS